MQSRLKLGEFVAMMALMISLTAFSIDAILPALGEVRTALNVSDPNQTQWVISLLFGGMAAGYLFYGPLSDTFGRKAMILTGFVIFMIGSVLCIIASDLHHLLIGRFLQGLGLASPRVVSMALVRDQYEGRAMARVMSFIMTVFILVPMLAPMLGQGIMWLAGWRAIFGVILVIGLISLTWFMVRQPETLPPEKRKPFSIRQILLAMWEVCSHAQSMAYILVSGLVFGSFVGYLSTVQQVFQGIYQTGAMFPLWFALLAAAIGFSSFMNGRLVMRLGMQRLTSRALSLWLVASVLFTALAVYWQGVPPFIVLMLYMGITLLCVGFLFGNLNALAMQPMGHIAGVAAAVVSALSNFIAVPAGMLIGSFYDDSVLPLALGFTAAAGGGLLVVLALRCSGLVQPDA